MFVLFVIVSEKNVCAKINRARPVARPYVYIPGHAGRGVYFIKTCVTTISDYNGNVEKSLGLELLFIFFYDDTRAKTTCFLFQSRCLPLLGDGHRNVVFAWWWRFARKLCELFENGKKKSNEVTIMGYSLICRLAPMFTTSLAGMSHTCANATRPWPIVINV